MDYVRMPCVGAPGSDAPGGAGRTWASGPRKGGVDLQARQRGGLVGLQVC
jgi:hypothetical protein